MASFLILVVVFTHGILMADGSIYPKLCQRTQDCDIIGQVCREKHCTCNREEGFEHNDSTDSCVKLAGAACINGTTEYECVEKATCNLQSGLCECDQGYTVNIYDECKRGYGDPCNPRRAEYLCSVSAMLVCDKRKRTCRCKDPETMVYDEERKICVSIVGAVCELEAWMGFKQECVANAECDGALDSIESYGRCKCNEGFRAFHGNRMCMKDNGDVCKEDRECVTGFCGYWNRCDCWKGMIYDEQVSECRASVGELCDEDGSKCGVHAVCDPWTRRCKCVDGYMPEGDLCIERIESDANTDDIGGAQVSYGSGGYCYFELVITCAVLTSLVSQWR